MRTSRFASWVIAAVLVGGAGVALAETAPENPVVTEDEVTTTTTAEVTTTTTEAPKKEAAEPETEADDAEGAQGEHGALVSAAAHDHGHDEACGNHGAVVSAVAKTGELPECAGGPAASTAASAPTKHGKGHSKKH
jgi:hypothetical protein